MSDQLVPNRSLFRFELPLRYCAAPVIDGDVAKWSDAHRLPSFADLDGHADFGKLWMGWNESGLFIACRVEGRSKPFQCNPKEFWRGDNLRLCTDMRDTRDIRRASRYCQQFHFLPAGGGKDGKSPQAGASRIHRAAAHAPLPEPGTIEIASRHEKGAYTIEARIPAGALAGFDPDEHRRIGLYTMLEDIELGQQYLTVGDELNWHIDPSTWATAVLTRD